MTRLLQLGAAALNLLMFCAVIAFLRDLWRSPSSSAVLPLIISAVAFNVTYAIIAAKRLVEGRSAGQRAANALAASIGAVYVVFFILFEWSRVK